MPAINVITPILGNRYYHIFNRGNNRRPVFLKPGNYLYFLKLFDLYLSPYVDLLAYCLLENHFHLLIKTKNQITDAKGMSSFQRDDIPEEEAMGKLISNQFRRLFISYTMALNKQEDTSGNLFDRPFKRLEIEKEDYLKYLTFYIHFNPEKHRFSGSFKDYPYSSWEAYNSSKPSKLNRNLLMEFFGDKSDFLAYHDFLHEEKEWLNLE